MSFTLKNRHKLVFSKAKKRESLCKSCVESCFQTKVVTKCPDYWERSK